MNNTSNETISYLRKKTEIKDVFKSCFTPEEKYIKIIELGRRLPPMPSELKTENNLVSGCQSTVYLHGESKEGLLFFSAFSEALISAGLAVLLIEVYSGETPETILTCKPFFLEELQIFSSLSPSRSNGLSQMYLHMQKEALKYL